MNGAKMIEMAVEGVGLFTPGFSSAQAWLSGRADPEQQVPDGKRIDPRTRRRTSVLTKALADVYGEAMQEAGFVAAEVAAVFGSALGEADTMIGILDQIFRQGADVSPMRFAMSVHNAAAGVVSTVTKNRGFTTSLGADFDTPAMALVEAAGLIGSGHQTVMVVCGDEGAPKDLVDDELKGWDLLAAAIALAPASTSNSVVRIRGPLLVDDPTVDQAVGQSGDATVLPGADVPRRVANNPQMGLFDLVDAALKRTSGTVRLDRGRGRGLCVEVRVD